MLLKKESSFKRIRISLETAIPSYFALRNADSYACFCTNFDLLLNNPEAYREFKEEKVDVEIYRENALFELAAYAQENDIPAQVVETITYEESG